MKHTRDTDTFKVETVLLEADDFVRLDAIAAKSGLPRNKARCALTHLRYHKAVDSIESSGALYWFLTPDTDNRTSKRTNRKVEEIKRKPAKPRVKTPRAQKLKY